MRIAPLLFVLACSNTPAPPVDAGRTYRDGAEGNCVPPGTLGNDAGVGGYCELTSDCPFGTLCTGLFGAPANDWFCSRLCDVDAGNIPCGEGAMCISDPRGIACVPLVCIGDSGVADSGSDSAADSGSDSASDSPTE
jgi:hypothetical protein